MNIRKLIFLLCFLIVYKESKCSLFNSNACSELKFQPIENFNYSQVKKISTKKHAFSNIFNLS